MLAVAVVAALVWANVPGSSSYSSFWRTSLQIRLGGEVLRASLRTWVNEGFMTLFFLVVGLEAARELSLGELRERRRALTPVIAACGGVAGAVGIFAAVTAGARGSGAWGAAASTDTALALGALSLVGPRGAARLRVFLLTLVVVDDLIGLLIITFAYSHAISGPALGAAGGLFVALILVRRLERWRGVATPVLGFGVWLAMFQSGVDPVIAGLAIGLVISAHSPARSDLERATELARAFREQPTAEFARSAQRGLSEAISPNERLQHRLHPWSGFVIVPLFALANIGVHIDGSVLESAVRSPVTIGILLGYVLGKPVGIVVSSWLASRSIFGARTPMVTWPGLLGTGAVAGVGFTVSLLVARRALPHPLFIDVQLGLLAALVVSPLLGKAVFSAIARLPVQVRARQIQGTAAELVDLAVDVDPERDHIRGGRDALVTLLEYADFECPFCGQAEPVIRELLASEGAELRYVFRHLPLNDVHPFAQLAAEAAEAAGAQGRFWEMHDLLFAQKRELRPTALLACAKKLELDVERFESELARGAHKARVSADVESADASGVSGTPTFFVNGRRHHGAYDLESLTRAVKAAALVGLPPLRQPPRMV